MTKSTITREQLLEIIETDHVQCGEASYLARMALAAMDSESWCLPLDYLQGHKDGLEWAAQLAEANHPETGDWLYDDPIELAKAIRKGPDVLPAQPAVDSEPVAIIDQANLDYLRSGADADVWPPEREEMGDVLLYRHPQPAPVVPEEKSIPNTLSMYAVDAVAAIAEVKGWNACRAAMLNQAQEPATYNTAPQPAVVSDEMIDTFEAEFRSAFKVSPEVKQMLEIGYHGEKFSFSIRDAATWWKLGCAAMLAAAPQSPGSEPATSPGKWIPVSERMPDENAEQQVLACFKGGDISTLYYFEGRWDDAYGIVPIRQDVTHWMPLPAGPKEVQGE